MSFGNKPVDGGNLLLTRDEVAELGLSPEQEARFIRRIYGSRPSSFAGNRATASGSRTRHLDEALAASGDPRAGRGCARDAAREQGHGVPTQHGRGEPTQIRRGSPSRVREYRHHRTPASLPRAASTCPSAYMAAWNYQFLDLANFALYDAPLWHLALSRFAPSSGSGSVPCAFKLRDPIPHTRTPSAGTPSLCRCSPRRTGRT